MAEGLRAADTGVCVCVGDTLQFLVTSIFQSTDVETPASLLCLALPLTYYCLVPGDCHLPEA